MKNKLRLISALLLAAAMAGLTACASDNGDAKDTTSGASTDTTVAEDTTTVETEPPRVSGLPEIDWEGRTANFITRNEEGYYGWYTFEIFAEEEVGEPLIDAVYQRNRALEEQYNFKITEAQMTDVLTTITNSVNAGDTTYDAIVSSGVEGALLAGQTTTNLLDVPYLDLSNEWWDQNAVRDFNVGGKVYFTVGDILISDKDGSWCWNFSKKVADDHGIEYPYESVKNGTWTYDKMYGMAKQVSADLNGDGQYTPDADLFGIAAENYDTYAAFFYSGAHLFESNDGNVEFVMNDERAFNAYTKYFDIVNDQKVYTIGSKEVEIKQIFSEGRTLFFNTTMLNYRSDFREIDMDFGLITAPKYDEAQENYGHCVSIGNSASVISIPKVVADLEFSGFVLESMCFAATDTIIDAYINKGFHGKYMRDEESLEILDIVIGSRVFDLSIVYEKWGGNLMIWLFNMKQGDTPDLASKYASIRESVEATIAETMEFYRDAE